MPIRDRSPPPGAQLIERKTSVEGNQVHTGAAHDTSAGRRLRACSLVCARIADSWYALPQREEHRHTKHIRQADFKYAGVGPVESGVPTALRQVRGARVAYARIFLH